MNESRHKHEVNDDGNTLKVGPRTQVSNPTKRKIDKNRMTNIDMCSNIVGSCITYVECSIVVGTCLEKSVNIVEKDRRMEKAKAEKDKWTEKREVKNYNLELMSNEIGRIERVGKGEVLKERARRKEKTKIEKWMREIVIGLLKGIEKRKKEERQMEMREIKWEIQRLIRLEKIEEKKKSLKTRFMIPEEPMNFYSEKREKERKVKI